MSGVRACGFALAWMAPAGIITCGLAYWIVEYNVSNDTKVWAENVLGLPLLFVDALLPFVAARVHRSWKVAGFGLVLAALIVGLALSMEVILFALGGGLHVK